VLAFSNWAFAPRTLGNQPPLKAMLISMSIWPRKCLQTRLGGRFGGPLYAVKENVLISQVDGGQFRVIFWHHFPSEELRKTADSLAFLSLVSRFLPRAAQHAALQSALHRTGRNV